MLKIDDFKGEVLALEGRGALVKCRKCGKPFRAYNPARIHCSEKCWLSTTPEERFWKKVDKTSSPTGCWLWTAAKSRYGYGAFRVDGRNYVATHFAWIASGRGLIPDGQILRHKCDNPPCVNPDHLELGTHMQNVHDCMERGRFKARGELSGLARVNRDQVIAMRILYCPNIFGYFRLARLFGISQAQAYRIVKSIDWSHVPSRAELLAQRDKWINSTPEMETLDSLLCRTSPQN